MPDHISDLLYRDWLNLNLHLLWCHDHYMMESYEVDIETFLRIERLLCNWLLTLNKVLRRYGVMHTGQFELDDRVRHAITLLNSRSLCMPLDLEDIAAKSGICENHLIRLFRENLQKTPYQYFDELRIEHACSLLKQPDTRIKEVTIELGFKYLSHFSKWFKKHTGHSPREYKKRIMD